MALKKQHFAEGEIPIFDEDCIYKRGEYWQFRMSFPKENKYVRKSLRTRTVAVPKTKIVKLEPQHQMTPNDTERTDFTPIHPQPPLPNQQDDREKR